MNTDNQQEIGLVGWFAGIVDGEGTISLSISRRASRSQMIRTSPKVLVANTDDGIVERCIEALRVIGVGHYIRCKRPPKGMICGVEVRRFKPVTTIEVTGFKRVRTLLKAILPFLAGEKHQRGQLLLRFVEGRIGFAESSKTAQNLAYRQEDVDNALAFLRLTKTKNIDQITKILNEHTREVGRTPEAKAKMSVARKQWWARRLETQRQDVL